jgi:ferredoxin
VPRRDPRPATGGTWAGAVAWLQGRTARKPFRSYRVRLLVQAGFAALCVAIGVQMARFVGAAERGVLPLPERPAGVDGFLPISGLMGLVDWIRRGALNSIHPAATVLLLVFLVMALVLRKSFCSWVCPVGFLSEGLARLGRRLCGRNFRPWKWLDVGLRSLKYLLLYFFAQAILRMSQGALQAFLESPYNRVSDIKMGLFFVELGQVGATVLVALVLLSVMVQGFWCRYLCPYGALLGLASWLSPTRVRRRPASCIDCGLCDRVCMARLPVSRRQAVVSPECTGCLDCVAACPVEDALGVETLRRPLTPLRLAAALVLLFLGGYATARATGAWQNSIGDREYIQRVEELRQGGYAHPGL